MKILISIFSTLTLLTLTSCFGDSSTTSGPRSTIDVTQVGYFKSKNKLRYFTFKVNNKSSLELLKFKDEVRKHGIKQSNTAGRVTTAFYYGNDQKVPDITMLDATKANTVAHDAKPIFTVWKLPTGKVNVFEKP